MPTQTKYHPNFRLEKWFLDCVTEDGNCFIIYATELIWSRWHITFSSLLNYHISNGLFYKSKIGNGHFPEKINQEISWRDKYFKISGIWKGKSESLHETLFENKTGCLNWNCYQPLANVSINFNKNKYDGFGYIEKLTLNTVPWNIPMDELRWGRFLSKEFHIVWIEYKKEQTNQWVWVNGEKIENWDISDTHLHNKSKQIRLLFGEKAILEKEKKILNVLKSLSKYLPGFRRIIPLKFLRADEKKWLNKSALTINDEIVCQGWTIHEFVNFNVDK